MAYDETEAKQIAASINMVKVGRLVYEVHAWMVGKDILP